MAWILRRKDSNEEVKLLANRDYVVGRKEADIILNNDQSISRKHAVLTISHLEGNLGNPMNIPVFKIIDTSKYGTTVNGKKVDGSGVIINSGDAIQFGILENHWGVVYKPFICVTSFLQKAEKALVRQCLAKIGGHIVPQWTQQCTLLIMTEISISIKVVNALASLCHIVTAKFLADFVTAAENNRPEPSHKMYVPPSVDPHLQEDEVSFLPNRARKSVFSEKKFYSVSPKQLSKLEVAISGGGGQVLLLDSSCGSLRNLMRDESTCILQPSNEELKQESVIQLTDQLEKYSLRCISEAEVGLAILHCSTDNFCNPRGSGDKDFLLQQLHSQSASLNIGLACSEQEQTRSPGSSKTDGSKLDDDFFNFDKDTIEDPFLQMTQEYSKNSDNLKPGTSEPKANSLQNVVIPAEGPSRGFSEQSRSPELFGHCAGPSGDEKMSTRDEDVLAKPSNLKTEDNSMELECSEPKQKDCGLENSRRGLSMSSQRIKPAEAIPEVPKVPVETRRNEFPDIQVKERPKPIKNVVPRGFLSARNLPPNPIKVEDDSLNGLETGFIRVKFVSLVKKRRLNEDQMPLENGHTKKNFKKFKKVLPKSSWSSSSRVVTFRPTDRRPTVKREPVAEMENGEAMQCTENYSQSQSEGLFDWPAHLRN